MPLCCYNLSRIADGDNAPWNRVATAGQLAFVLNSFDKLLLLRVAFSSSCISILHQRSPMVSTTVDRRHFCVTVYGSSSSAIAVSYKTQARSLGRLIAEEGWVQCVLIFTSSESLVPTILLL
jgi:hypothetical protein